MNGRIVVYLAAAAVCMYSRQTQGATAASTTTIPFYIVPYGHGGRNLQNFCGIGRCCSAAAATLIMTSQGRGACDHELDTGTGLPGLPN